MDKDALTKTIELSATMDNLEPLCSFAKDTCRSYPALAYSGEELYKVELAVSEAVTNVIKYAYRGMDTGTVRMEVQPDSSGVTIKVKDRGIGFDFEKACRLPPPGLACEGGRGIYLIKSVADNVSYSDEGPFHVLTMRFSLRGDDK